MTSTVFTDLNLPPALLSNLRDLGYHSMTPIQAQALPRAIAGRNLIAQAKTGSGKTAAFAIPLLLQLNPRYFGVQGLVLCPTRELGSQVAAEIRRIARYQENIKVVTLSGGQSIGPQIGSLEHGAHIVVGTPGRIKDHLHKQTLDLSGVKMLVLDEADRMLDMGFMEDMEAIISHTHAGRQTLLFSATYPDDIKALSDKFQRDPEQVVVESRLSGTAIAERFFLSSKETKLDDLIQVLRHIQVPSAVIFCNMKQTAQEVAHYLDSRRFNAKALHGDLEQRERDQVLTQFRHQSCSILVATDVAARGLDVENLPAVINYDLPRDPEIYVHRIGRTARAGKDGLAVSLLDEHERHRLEKIAKYQENTLNLEYPDKLRIDPSFSMLPTWKTLVIAGGRKDKIRPGDVLGALTGEAGLPGDAVGKIDITDFSAYVTVDGIHANTAVSRLANGKIKGRRFKVRLL